MKRVEEDLSRAHCPVMAPSQPEGFGAEGTRSGLKIDRNCLPGSLLHWTTFEVNIKATFPAQAGFSFPTNYRRTKLDLRTTRSTFCSWGNSTQSLKGWRNMPRGHFGQQFTFHSFMLPSNKYNLILQDSHISYCFGFESFVLLQGCSRRKFEWLCFEAIRSLDFSQQSRLSRRSNAIIALAFDLAKATSHLQNLQS